MNNAFDPSSSRSIDSQRTMRGDAPAPARRLRAGDVLLARYTVLSELGEGGMGVVYKCLDQVGGIEVAVKCLPPELSRNEGEMEGIRENYGIVAKLHHSAISGLRQLERDPASGEYYLVMDLAEGEDLSAILRRRRGRPMPLEEALAILRPLASALDYAHGERVLHRDVKPANVKVRTLAAETQAVEGRKSNVKGRDSNLGPSDIGPSTRLRVQLLDFGLAAEVRSSMSRVSVRGHGGASGTPAYMAPEQWEARRPDFRTDQYALAVVAYQMLAGFLPFDSEDTDLLRRAVLSRAPDPVEGLSPAANAALLRALSKDPKERFPTCGAFVAALEVRDGSTSRPPDGRAVGASLPEPAGGEGRDEAHVESAEPGPAGGSGIRRFLLVAALVAVVGLFAFLAWPRHRPPAEPVPAVETVEAVEMVEAVEAEPPVVPVPDSATDTEAPLEELPATEPDPLDLPPPGAPLADLEAAQERLKVVRDELAGKGFAPTDPERAPVEAALGNLETRIEEALAEEARRAREAEREGRRAAAQRAADLQEIENIRRAVERRVSSLDATWTDGEFAKRRSEIAAARRGLEGCTDAASLARAKELRSEIYDAADWIERNTPARSGLAGQERELGALVRDCAAASADTLAAASYRRAESARREAEAHRDAGRFEDAASGCASAKGLYEKARAEARAAKAAAEIESARTYEKAGMWDACLAAAQKALEWEPGNADATALKAEAEKNLKPTWTLSATSPAAGGAGVSPAAGATLSLGGRTYTLPITLTLETGKTYGPGEVTLERGGKTYVGSLARTTADWKGERKTVIALSERRGPKSGDIARIELGAGISLEMVFCPGVEPDFWMGKFEVTQEQWNRLMETNPSSFKDAKKPVETVSWNDCQDFIRKLNARPAVKESGLMFRLPSEAEWEMACRAGSTGAFCKLADGTEITASTIGRVAWFSDNSGDKTHPVGQKEPNAFGLYDMHGNVWEWTGTAVGEARVSRGGSWGNSAWDCGSFYRSGISPSGRRLNLGFRLCASGKAD